MIGWYKRQFKARVNNVSCFEKKPPLVAEKKPKSTFESGLEKIGELFN